MGGSGDDDVRFAHEFAIYTTSSSYNTQSDYLPNSYQLLLDGGEGNDTLLLSGSSGVPRALLSGGAGNDELKITEEVRYASMTGGAGIDTFVLTASNVENAEYWDSTYGLTSSTLIITDFEVGEGGDVVDIGAFVDTDYLSGYSSGNPFHPDSGYLRFSQIGSSDDSLLEIDRDGASGSTYSWLPVVKLASVDVDTISAWNTSLGRRVVGDSLAFTKPEIALANDSGSSKSDRLTNDPTLKIYNANQGGELQISLDEGSNWQAWDPGNQPNFDDGYHKIYAREIYNGATSEPEIYSFTLKTSISPPSGLSVSASSDTGMSNADGITSDTTPTFTATTEVGSTVELFAGGQSLGRSSAADGNSFSFVPSKISTTTDNSSKVYLNGVYLGSTSSLDTKYVFDDFTLLDGDNVLAIESYDSGGVASMSAQLEDASGNTVGTSQADQWKVFLLLMISPIQKATILTL